MAVEQLFFDLGNTSDGSDINLHPELSHPIYTRALEKFLAQTEGPLREGDRAIPYLREVAQGLLGRYCTEYGLRIAFMESIASLLWDPDQQLWGVSQRSYMSMCRWIFRGRKVGGIPPQDYDHLSHTLTVPTKCANCARSPAYFACTSCTLRHDSHITICTMYCNELCLVLHRSTHQSTCVQRVRLMRSVAILKAIFTIVSKELSIFSPAKCQETDGMTFLSQDDPFLDCLRGNFLLHKFPRESFGTKRHDTMVLHSQYSSHIRPDGIIRSLLDWLWERGDSKSRWQGMNHHLDLDTDYTQVGASSSPTTWSPFS